MRRGYDPNVRRVLWIGVPFIVLPINRTRDYVDVALAFICSRGGRTRFVLGFFLFLFCHVLGVRLAGEHN